jgi:hypothetical protein
MQAADEPAWPCLLLFFLIVSPQSPLLLLQYLACVSSSNIYCKAFLTHIPQTSDYSLNYRTWQVHYLSDSQKRLTPAQAVLSVSTIGAVQ